MFKFAAAIVDFYDDPEFIKKAQEEKLFDLPGKQLLLPEEASTLRDDGFAVKVATAAGEHRKFPIYSPVATKISGAYFDEIAENLPEEIRKTAGYFLKKAHVEFGLPLPRKLQQDFEEPESRKIEYQPDAEPPPLVKTAEEGIRLAESLFSTQGRFTPILEKVAKARDISEAAAMADVPIHNRDVWDYAPKDVVGPYFKEMLTQREVLVKAAGDGIKTEQFKAILDEAAKLSVREIPFLIHEFDKAAGFSSRYGLNGIIDPFYGTWGGHSMPKTAGVEEDLKKYKLQTLGRNVTLLESTFSPKFVERFIRDPVGAYETATPAEKKALDFYASKVPSTMTAGEIPTLTQSGNLEDEIAAATKDLKAEQEKPSDRPESGMPYAAIREIHEGL